MDLPVLIEPTSDNHFRASLNHPPLQAEGATKEAALENLRNQLDQRLQSGVEIVPLQLGNAHEILQALAKMEPYRDDDPLIQEWLQIIEENRRKDDEEEGIER